MEDILKRVWDGAGETWEWLRGVILGEWEDDRSLSQCVTDAIAGFVPGIGTIITVRDLIAIIVRLAKYPEKRADVEEWILLIAMLIPLILTAITALAAGVGAIVGAELGGFLRAVALFTVKKGGVAMRAVVEFLQGHGYGNAVKAMREVKFSQYSNELVKGLSDQITKIEELVRGVQTKLRQLSPESLPNWLPGRARLVSAIDHCDEFLQQLKALRSAANDMIPKAVKEMDARVNALLAGDIKSATRSTHTITTGKTAPAVAKLQRPAAESSPGAGLTPAKQGEKTERMILENHDVPEPGNTRRVRERRVVALEGKREYKYVDKHGVPVGAKRHIPGQKLENPPVEADIWDAAHSGRVTEGYPDLTTPDYRGRTTSNYDTFSNLCTGSLSAGTDTQLKRVVSHDSANAEYGTFYNRELPIDGEDLRAGSAVKESWNKNGEFIELNVPQAGDPIWREIHLLQQQSENAAAAAAGRKPAKVPFAEELKFWEGPAASQVYKKQLDDGTWILDDFYQVGGKEQQVFDRHEIALLKERGFISQRKPTDYPDFDAELGNIVPKDGPFLEVIPLHQAIPAASAGVR